jgi:HTH-type transcriptional regulator/antitoxin HigA
MVNKVDGGYTPDYAVTPAEMLEYELDARGMTQKELTNRMGVSPKHINELLSGKAPISAKMAIKLEYAIGMPAQYWLNLEANYQAIVARLGEEAELEADLSWLSLIPFKEMSKLGWLSDVKDKKQRLVTVLRFFGIANVKQWDKMWDSVNVAYRQTKTHKISPVAVSAWLRQGEIEADKIDCQPFDKKAFRHALDSIRSLTTETPKVFLPALTDYCAAAGVAVVFVPMLPKTGVSGATRWMNKDKAIIQLSLRYKSDDHLWFTFFHEAGHILLHGKKELFLEGINGLDSEKEDEANKFSSKELIPGKTLEVFARTNVLTKENISRFAKESGISEGIVVGQLQHQGLLRRNHCNDLKQFFKWAHEEATQK